MSSYERHYNSILLDELHNYFPALLYQPEQFSSVYDVLQYIRTQARDRFDLFSSAQRRYAATQIPTSPFQYPPVGPQPSTILSPLTPRQTPPRNRDAMTVTLETTHMPLLDTLLQSFTNPNSTMTAANGLDTLLLSMLMGNNGLQRGGGVLPPGAMEPVIVRPTQQQINAGSILEIVDAEEDVCAICQDRMEPGSQARCLTACDHRFHPSCIETWFQQNVRCPVCRHDIRESEEDDVMSEHSSQTYDSE